MDIALSLYSTIAIVVGYDVLLLLLVTALAVNSSIRPRVGDIFYIYLVQWMCMCAFFSSALGSTNLLTVIGVMCVSTWNHTRLTSSMLALSAHIRTVSIGLIRKLEYIACGVLLTGGLFIMASTYSNILRNEIPFLALAVGLGFVTLSLHCFLKSRFRTWINIIYFQLLFDNRFI